MADNATIHDHLDHVVDDMVESYLAEPRTHHIGKRFLPSRSAIVEIIHRLFELMYPGFYGRQDLTEPNIREHVAATLDELARMLHQQIHQCLCYERERRGELQPDNEPCDKKALRLALEFLERLPNVRDLLAGDVQAAYDGDPAATGTDEVILAYPGLMAVTVYRLAHELHVAGVPLMPRIMTEWAHGVTGVDIHPGARIGRNFFIDHATGVVIGETTEIGDNVKIYQGVTLGALSFPKDERGRIIRGSKRHPTIEDGVVIYAGATVLGGTTRIGSRSEVGGSVFLTRSVPANSVVKLKAPELKVRSKVDAGDPAADMESAPQMLVPHEGI